MIKFLNARGQSLLEYSVLIIVIIGVFIVMQNYVRRGFEGRLKTAVDDYGDQYDPRLVNSSITHTLNTTSNTAIVTIPVADGQSYTNRIDMSHSIETKDGFIAVGDQTEPNGI